MGKLNLTSTRWIERKFRLLVGPAMALFVLGWPVALRSQSLPAAVAQERSQLLKEKWSPARLYSILNSQDPAASEDLYRAAFAAGPAIIRKLEDALKDDRTAEFAAQTLAYFGDARSLIILRGLLKDPRNLDLRRFYYGALGGRNDPHDIEILLNKIRTSDHEPDRTVTRDAILALSISSDAELVPKLRQVEKQVNDPVIKDDIETATMIIGLRAQYMATPAGKNSGSSVNRAINTYFMPALQAAPGAGDKSQQDSKVEVHVRHLTYSPDKTRVLAAVDFENPEAVASYQMILQKIQAAWKVASVWLGDEREKPQPTPPSTVTPQK